MRDFKYRGRDKKGKWHYGSLVLATDRWHRPRNGGFHREWIAEHTYSNGGFINLAVRFCVAAETVGQFTGLYDKEKKPIYEGDIVQYTRYEGRKVIRVVIWNKTGFEARKTLFSSELGFTIDTDEILVIGNIHDNPELLEHGD